MLLQCRGATVAPGDAILQVGAPAPDTLAHNVGVPELRYRRPVLDQLPAHGVEPQPGTAPSLVRAHLNDFYTFELRKNVCSNLEPA
ncbi:MAG TPA: hypothetical protein VMS86_02950 [Thermoanaerobaculia bacterium]|nr:hypothetical protein [Thermoanaerobaculia bacterium]